MVIEPTAVVLIISLVLIFLLALTLNLKSVKLNKDTYQKALIGIKNNFEDGQYQLVVLNSDKLVDQALKDLKIKGSTMGERLKNCKNLKFNLNQIWQVHKLRNKVAHEVGFQVSKAEAQFVYSSTRDNLKKINAI
jgi:hypothetical protein